MNIKGIFKNSPVLFRLAFTVPILILIPMLIYVWLSLNQSAKRLNEQENLRRIQISGQFSSYTQSQRTNMIAIAARISYEGRITTPKFWHQTYDEIEIIQNLKQYRDLSQISDSLYLYFRGSDFLIGSDGKYNRSTFLSDSLDFVRDESALKKMQFALDESDEITVFSSSGTPDKNANMYISVPFSFATHNDTIALFIVNRMSLDDSFLGNLNSGICELYIFDTDNNLLISNTNTLYPYINSPEFIEFLQNDLTSFNFSFNGSSHTIYKICNQQLGMQFVTLPISDSTDNEISSFYRSIRIVILLVVLLSLALSVFFIYFNYKPLLDTIRRISQLDGENDIGNNGGELEFIERSFMKKFSENNALLDNLAEQQLLLIDSTVKNILSGKIPSDEQLILLGLPTSEQHYCVMTICRLSENAIVFTDNFLEKLKNNITDTFSTALCVSDTVDSGIVLLFSFDFLNIELLRQVSDCVYSLISEPDMDDLIIGVGTIEFSRTQIYSSYINSNIAAELAVHPGIHNFNDISTQENKPKSYPNKAALHFHQYIRQGDIRSAMKEYDTILDYITNIRSTILQHYIRCDFINSYLNTLSSIPIEISPNEKSDILALSNYPELRIKVEALAERACNEILEQRRDMNRTRMGLIINYINQNATDPDLGLPMIAAHFNISMSSLSTGFNEAMGCGLREYIVNCRLETAKSLLLDGNLSVKDIAVQVGFRDVSYFIKLFKAATGYTPSKFRENRTS